jgi:RND family efflux transporter MFP subunit
MKTKITPVLITIAIVGFVVWKLVENKQTIDRNAELSLIVNTVVPVKVEKPQYASIDQQFSVNGQIVSGNEVGILSKTTAVVLKKYKKAGDAVGKGIVIAQLENNVICENLRNTEIDFAKAQKDVERYRNLAASGAVTTLELEEKQINLRSIENRIAELKDQLANTAIVSPVSGVINKDFFEEGMLLTAGSKVADIVDNKYLKMKVNVTEKEMLKLKKGEKALITTDIYADKTFFGTIDVIAPKGNDLYNYAVELKLDNNDDIKSGMYATVIFDRSGNNAKSIVVNRKAIVGGMKNPSVFVIRDNKACKVSVQLGQVNNDIIEITQGLSMDDIVVISGQINLKDGSEVSILKS